MALKIATVHTDRRCRYCKHNLFTGCGYFDLGKGKYKCEKCHNLIVWYLAMF